MNRYVAYEKMGDLCKAMHDLQRGILGNRGRMVVGLDGKPFGIWLKIWDEIVPNLVHVSQYPYPDNGSLVK
jgi:hypothetical protein